MGQIPTLDRAALEVRLGQNLGKGGVKVPLVATSRVS